MTRCGPSRARRGTPFGCPGPNRALRRGGSISAACARPRASVLNGRDLGTLIGPAYVVTIERGQWSADNVLEIEVSNLMANRIADMDRRGQPWKIFYNVNMPASRPENRGADGLFDAARWEPRPSGLIGPVTLTPLAPVP